MKLSEGEVKLVIHMLRAASEMLSNVGCNDFDLSPFLNKEEMTEFVKSAFIANGEEEEFKYLNSKDLAVALPDYWIASYLASKLEK